MLGTLKSFLGLNRIGIDIDCKKSRNHRKRLKNTNKKIKMTEKNCQRQQKTNPCPLKPKSNDKKVFFRGLISRCTVL